MPRPSSERRGRSLGPSSFRPGALPRPIVEARPRRSKGPFVVLTVLALVGVGVFVVIRELDGGDTAAGEPDTGPVVAAPAGLLDERVVLLDTDGATIDGDFASIGALEAGVPVEVPVRGRYADAGNSNLVALTLTRPAADGDDMSAVTVATCDVADPAPGTTTTHHALVSLGDADTVCVSADGPAEVRVELAGFLDPAEVQPIANPVRIVDTRADGETDDERFAGIGVRPEVSTLRVPVTTRFDGLEGFGAVLVGITAADAIGEGPATLFAAEASPPATPQLSYFGAQAVGATAIVPLGPSGDLCVSTRGRTDLVVDLLALVPATVTPPIEGEGECPDQGVFPGHRMVAMYGTQRTERLGVLGEQDPEASVARIEELTEPWRAGDRPVRPAFELIATLATATAEDRGVYNLRSSPEFVQEYLDVARRHGYYLILDLQPGQSDFLTEAKYYDEFLRQPDVGLALDPEWRTDPPARPRGGSIGTVDAAEVNQVIEYLAGIVAEEDLPEKLLVLHQFTDRMVTNRDQLVELPGVALTIHMDGFGDRPSKQSTWSLVKADPPWNMAVKLFFDEDIDIYTAADVLGGAFDPIPDLITYQ